MLKCLKNCATEEMSITNRFNIGGKYFNKGKTTIEGFLDM